jgi:hypothetical protein
MIPQHSSETQEHYTPRDIVEAAREVLGGIDLDPASCLEAQQTVRAERYFTRGVNGLFQPWSGRVFLNPPGGTFTARRKSTGDEPVTTAPEDTVAKERWKTDSRAVGWWRKLIAECAKPPGEDVTAAIFIGFTLEILRTSQEAGWISAMDFPFCVPSERLHFSGDSPTHANAIVYVGSDVEKFVDVFSKFGAVKR